MNILRFIRQPDSVKRRWWRHSIAAWWYFITGNEKKYGYHICEVIRIEDENSAA